MHGVYRSLTQSNDIPDSHVATGGQASTEITRDIQNQRRRVYCVVSVDTVLKMGSGMASVRSNRCSVSRSQAHCNKPITVKRFRQKLTTQVVCMSSLMITFMRSFGPIHGTMFGLI